MRNEQKLNSIFKEIELGNGCAPSEDAKEICRKVMSGEMTEKEAMEKVLKTI